MNNLLTNLALNQSSQKQIFQKNLLDWYDLQKRELPWRTNPSLYKTVVSEFMLQQTRVSTALPYFETWIKKFPDFKTLALASEDEVLKALTRSDMEIEVQMEGKDIRVKLGLGKKEHQEKALKQLK